VGLIGRTGKKNSAKFFNHFLAPVGRLSEAQGGGFYFLFRKDRDFAEKNNSPRGGFLSSRGWAVIIKVYEKTVG